MFLFFFFFKLNDFVNPVFLSFFHSFPFLFHFQIDACSC